MPPQSAGITPRTPKYTMIAQRAQRLYNAGAADYAANLHPQYTRIYRPDVSGGKKAIAFRLRLCARTNWKTAICDRRQYQYSIFRDVSQRHGRRILAAAEKSGRVKRCGRKKIYLAWNPTARPIRAAFLRAMDAENDSQAPRIAAALMRLVWYRGGWGLLTAERLQDIIGGDTGFCAALAAWINAQGITKAQLRAYIFATTKQKWKNEVKDGEKLNSTWISDFVRLPGGEILNKITCIFRGIAGAAIPPPAGSGRPKTTGPRGFGFSPRRPTAPRHAGGGDRRENTPDKIRIHRENEIPSLPLPSVSEYWTDALESMDIKQLLKFYLPPDKKKIFFPD